MSAGRLVEGSSASLGLRVVWSAPPVVDELLAAMLGGDGTSEPSPGRGPHPAELGGALAEEELALDFSDVAARLPYAAPTGFERSFYQDRIVAYAGPTAFLFQDDASEVRVPLGRGPIIGRLHASSLEDRRVLRLLLDLALTMALRCRGLFHLHAAGAVRGDTCILLPGLSGAGKTSSMLALVEAGWSYLSDDSVFLRARGDGIFEASPRRGQHQMELASVVAQRREFHLTPATLKAYPSLGAIAGSSSSEPSKVRVAPDRAFPGRFREVAPPPALLLFPTVTDAEASAAEPIVDAVAFGHLLMASTMLSVPGTPHTKTHLDLLKHLVGGAACFELRLGADFLHSPARAVAKAIEPLVARAPAAVVSSREP